MVRLSIPEINCERRIQVKKPWELCNDWGHRMHTEQDDAVRWDDIRYGLLVRQSGPKPSQSSWLRIIMRL